MRQRATRLFSIGSGRRLGVVPILDQLGIPAAAAYSLRQVRLAASLACRVRRSSDNAELNIGFTASGDLDTAALLAFVGSGNGFVTTWYDQSGNGRNATQTDPTFQPQIVSNGALITENGRPAVLVSNDYMASQSFSGLTSYTLNTVYNASAIGEYSMAVVLNPGQVEFRRSQNLSYMEYIVNSSTAITLNTASLGAQAIMTATVTNADQKAYVNGLLEGSQTSSPTAAILVSIGNRSDGAAYPYTGTMQEITLFNSVLSNTDRQTLDRSQGAYYGITVA